MKSLREIWGSKDKKTQYKLVAALFTGVLLIVLSNRFLKTEPKERVQQGAISQSKEAPANAVLYDGYEEKLEKKLEAVISQIDGVGKTKVMLTLSDGSELVLAKDESLDESRTLEEDGGGGRRELTSTQKEGRTIMADNDPLVLKELKPKIEGIIIVAEGGGDVWVKETLIKSAQALFGVEAHKIEVLKMKK